MLAWAGARAPLHPQRRAFGVASRSGRYFDTPRTADTTAGNTPMAPRPHLPSILTGALVLLLAGLLGAPPAVEAQVQPTALQVGAAYFDVGGDAHETAALELTYRPHRLRLWRVSARLGGMFTARRAAYAYGGLELPLRLTDRTLLNPSLGAGAYRQGEGPDLGGVLEFRSGIDLSRTLADGHQVTLFLYHLSNASLGRRNPGVEVLGVAYAVSW